MGSQACVEVDEFIESLRATPEPREPIAGATEAVWDLPPYEIIGPHDAPLVVVLGGISATRHVTSTDSDPREGWWEAIVGPGRAIDTTRYRVLGFDFLDGGATESGHPARLVTTHDQAGALVRILDTLGVRRAHAIVGASYGGMVALATAERYADRVDRIVVISAPHEAHPMSTAVRSVQRRIVQLGIGTGRVRETLALARSLAMTTYRSGTEFAQRFDSAPVSCSAGDATFPVEVYLRHQGERFAARWLPERFLALSLSGDLHRIDPRRVTTPAVLIAAEGDAIVPEVQMEELAATLVGSCRLVRVPTQYGHDAFLTESEKVGSIISNALTASTLS